MSPFWGYQNEDPNVTSMPLGEFQDAFPLNGGYENGPPTDWAGQLRQSLILGGAGP